MAGHFANPPEIAELIGTNQVAAYALPLGVMLHLWRAIAGHKPAVLTHVGWAPCRSPGGGLQGESKPGLRAGTSWS